MKNKYCIRSRISEPKFREILRLFCLDIEAKKVAELTGISRVTINKIFDKLRVLIASKCELESPFETGEIELKGHQIWIFSSNRSRNFIQLNMLYFESFSWRKL